MTPAKFKEIRISLNLTQAEMAFFVGLRSRRLIQYYEAGTRNISSSTLEILKLKLKKRKIKITLD